MQLGRRDAGGSPAEPVLDPRRDLSAARPREDGGEDDSRPAVEPVVDSLHGCLRSLVGTRIVATRCDIATGRGLSQPCGKILRSPRGGGATRTGDRVTAGP